MWDQCNAVEVTVEVWKSIKIRIENLCKGIEMDWRLKELLPVLDEFIKAVSGSVVCSQKFLGIVVYAR